MKYGKKKFCCGLHVLVGWRKGRHCIRTYSAGDNYNHLDSVVGGILPLDAAFTLRTRFENGSQAMLVEGCMAEVAAGKEFEALFQELLAVSLRMPRSHFTPVGFLRQSGGG